MIRARAFSSSLTRVLFMRLKRGVGTGMESAMLRPKGSRNAVPTAQMPSVCSSSSNAIPVLRVPSMAARSSPALTMVEGVNLVRERR